MREYLSCRVRANVRRRVVFPSPGTPSSRTWPEARRQIRTPSTTSSCPTMIFAISRRTALSRSTASWSVASDPTLYIVEHPQGRKRDGRREKSAFVLKCPAFADLSRDDLEDRCHLRQCVPRLYSRPDPSQPI